MRWFISSFLVLFLAFVLEHFPVSPSLSWLMPQWVALAFMFIVLNIRGNSRFVLAVFVGILMDVEHLLPLGSHVVAFALLVYCIDLLRNRMFLLNVLQQMAVAFLLVASYQVALTAGQMLVIEYVVPGDILLSSVISALVWPWLRLVLQQMFRKVSA